MLNAGRKYLGLNDLSGKVFLTSGLGGMSGAQAKAATISGCIGIIAEVLHLITLIKIIFEKSWLFFFFKTEMFFSYDRSVTTR